MYRSLFPRDLFAEFDRLQRDMSGLFEPSPSIRGLGRGGYPALNVGSTATGVEVFAFAPGIDPASLDIQLDRGVLTIAGERKPAAPAASDEKTTLHLNERFDGRFRRVISMPDDIDPATVTAEYRDGVLRVGAQRRAAAQARRDLLDGLKAGGILCEARWQGGAAGWVAVGLGLNVRNDVPEDLATSAIALASQLPGAAPELLRASLVDVIRRAVALSGALTPAELADWAARDWLLGRPLSAPVAGEAAGLSPDGALQVRAGGGTTLVRAGSVELAPVSGGLSQAGDTGP